MRGALVLAGGKSSRFGRKKALAKLAGRPLLLHVLDSAMSAADEVLVAVGREDQVARYRQVVGKSVRVLKDRVHNKSPLVGIVTGFQAMKSRYSLVLSCDTPFARPDVLELLFEKAVGSDAAIPRWPNGDLEPLQSVYKVGKALPAAKLALGQGAFRMVDMIKQLRRVTYVPVREIKRLDGDLVTFFNVNTEGDLVRAEAALTPNRSPSSVSS